MKLLLFFPYYIKEVKVSSAINLKNDFCHVYSVSTFLHLLQVEVFERSLEKGEVEKIKPRD